MTTRSWNKIEHFESLYTTRTEAYTNYFGQPVAEAWNEVHSQYDLQTSDSFVGNDQPKWRDMIKNGANAMNTANGQRTEFSHGSVTGSARYYYQPSFPPKTSPVTEFRVQYKPIYGPPTVPGLSSTAYNAALMGFVRKANKKISSFSGGPFLGELRETIHLLKRPVTGIKYALGNYLSDLDRNRNRAPRQKGARRRFVANKWLECSFGIKPLINDIKDGAEAASRLVNGFMPNDHVSFWAEDVVQGAESGYATKGNINSVNWYESTLIRDESRVTVYGNVILENPGTPKGVADVLGIRPDQFVPTLWELIPYSWLVDYFSNVGEMIEAACFNMARLRWHGCSSVTKRKNIVRFHGNATNTSLANYIGSSVGGSNGEMITTNFSRFTPPSLVPSLSLNFPTKWTQWANMGAVALQSSRLTPY